jgi:hypothetical protein
MRLAVSNTCGFTEQAKALPAAAHACTHVPLVLACRTTLASLHNFTATSAYLWVQLCSGFSVALRKL